MSWIDRLNSEHEYVKDFGEYIVCVDKVGGGAVGQTYTGRWDYTVWWPDGFKLESDNVETGYPHVHSWVADFIYGDLSD